MLQQRFTTYSCRCFRLPKALERLPDLQGAVLEKEKQESVCRGSVLLQVDSASQRKHDRGFGISLSVVKASWGLTSVGNLLLTMLCWPKDAWPSAQCPGSD